MPSPPRGSDDGPPIKSEGDEGGGGGAPKAILVGRVSGAFGIKGELRLAAFTEEPLALLRYRRLLREDGRLVLTLTGGRAVKSDVIARAAEVESREQAEALRGVRLYVPRSALPPPEDEDEFYLADLVGLAAVSPEGERLGRVAAVLNHGAGDILEIDPGAGRPTLLYPFTREVVPAVDVTGGRLTLIPPPEIEADDPQPGSA